MGFVPSFILLVRATWCFAINVTVCSDDTTGAPHLGYCDIEGTKTKENHQYQQENKRWIQNLLLSVKGTEIKT